MFVQDQVIQPQSWQEKSAVCLFLYHQQANMNCWLSQLVECPQKHCALLNEQREEEVKELPASRCTKVFRHTEEEERAPLQVRSSDSTAEAAQTI